MDIKIDMEAVEKYQIFGSDLIIYSYIKSLSKSQSKEWVVVKTNELAELFNVGFNTIYRSLVKLYKIGAIDKRMVLNNCREYKVL